MKTKETFDLWFWCCLIAFAIIITGICFLPSLLIKPGQLDFRETGQIGDTIGGIMGPFVAIAASILTFIAFWVQFKANIQQRHDIAIERFEHNFYEMLQLHSNIRNSLDFIIIEDEKEVHYPGVDAFDCLYTRIQFQKNGVTYEGIKRVFAQIPAVDAYDLYLSEYFVHCLDNYFRMLYRIIKYVDESHVIDDNQKYNYVCILRATLSWYELLVLFYNGLSDNGNKHFKPLVEKYALFNNLRIEELASSDDQVLYQSKLNADYPFSRDENRNMSLEYKKGAFVHNI